MQNQPRNRRISRRRHYRKRRLIVVIAAAAGLVLALFGLVRLIGYGMDLLSSRNTSSELREVYYAGATEEPVPETEAPTVTPAATTEPTSELTEAPAVVPTETAGPTQSPIPRLAVVKYPGNPRLQISSRFRQLRKESRNIIGWLTIAGQVDDAVVQKDNVYYLDHDALGKQNVNGALFLDSAISLKTRPYTYIIYGHNMKTGAMFGNLRNYENITYYHNDPFITFDTMYENGRYVVFSAGSIYTEPWGRNYVDFFSLISSNIQEREASIKTLISASVHTCSIDVRPEDQLLILVTCVESDEERRVVAARRLRDGEDENSLKRQVGYSRRK